VREASQGRQQHRCNPRLIDPTRLAMFAPQARLLNRP